MLKEGEGFAALGLRPELLTRLEELDHRQPTPIQRQAIPPVLAGEDLIGLAQTGTGKTAAFALPMIQRLGDRPMPADYHPIRGLILVPTRELAQQVGDNTLAYGARLGMRVISIFGGVRFDNQIRKMKRGADILVATPGRLLDMLRQRKLSLEALEMLVLDEADRMLDLGFAREIGALLELMPARRQTLLFSATLDERVSTLADRLLQNPQRISVAPRNAAASGVRQRAWAVDGADKAQVLAWLITEANWQQTLVFVRTRARADALCTGLQAAGIDAGTIHGGRAQRERQQSLDAFAAGELGVLVATDLAARGLDIQGLPRVVNFDLPRQPQDHVHRIGRTGRAGRGGLAVSLVAPEEYPLLEAIERLTGRSLPLHPLPSIEQGRLIESRTPLDRGSRRKGGKKGPAKGAKKTAGKAEKGAAPVDEQPPARSAGRRSLFSR